MNSLPSPSHISPPSAGQPLDGKSVVIGVCGGIAAYKACELIRECQKQGTKSVRVIATPSAFSFVGALTFESLTRQPVLTDELGVDEAGTPWHIALAKQADVMIVVPATANTLAKLAHGQADDMLSTTALCWEGKPLIIAPAMNPRMWHHPAVQANLATLRQWPNITLVPPSHGLLACGEEGVGHLAPLPSLMQALAKALQPQKYTGFRFMVTAGGTAEPIDPVRHITNRSSGKMGVAFADQLWQMGAEVTLLATHTVSDSLLLDKPYTIQRVQTSAQLSQAMHSLAPHHHGVVMAAAVSDFMLPDASTTKLKRGESDLTLTLQPNTDVIAQLIETHPHLFTLGFAAETGEDLSVAVAKLKRKGLDALCLNDVSRSDIGFGTDVNEMTLILRQDVDYPQHLPKADKQLIARQVLWALADEVKTKTEQKQASEPQQQNTACSV